MALVTIIIPSFNNLEYLDPCVRSIMVHQSTVGLFEIIVVNNGTPGTMPKDYDNPSIKVIEPGKNLGWEGGLKEGLKHATTPYVVFMNDDTYIPLSSAYWLYAMLQHFADPKVAAVGPGSNCVMGLQNIFCATPAIHNLEVNFLIGFCLMVRRSALDEVGGVDDSLPYHGDDLDLSIRFREKGYKLICDKSVFVWHYGFKTGQREFGSEWNSVQMTEKTNDHLIDKHGLKNFIKYTFNPMVIQPERQYPPDTEGDICRKFAKGKVLELGCGGQKTVPDSTGLDIIPKGNEVPGLPGKLSIADIVADINEPLPLESATFDTVISRHILEHLVSTRKILEEWGRVVKPGGRMIIAVPNQETRQTIPLNYQHVRAFTPQSLTYEMESLGWHTEHVEDSHNGISFVGVYNKNGV
jgi:GT2 family glycosyltransferase